MVPIMSLWLPILLGAGLVFVVSSIIHMLLPYHRSDFRSVAAEDEVMDALRPFDIPPGDYIIPCAKHPNDMKTSEFQAKVNKGPVVAMTVYPTGPFSIGKNLVQWFIYSIVVGFLTAYIASRALGPGEEYMAVFRLTGTAAFYCYSLALLQNSIWHNKSWAATLKSFFDGFIYALVTAGAFAWLWPA